MNSPNLELLPLKPAVSSQGLCAFDILAKVIPPEADGPRQRPALNLGLVLDRSGSMAAQKKIGFAREAATLVVSHLLPTDRISVTIFDQEVETLVPNQPAADKARLVDLIRRVTPRWSTNLFGGWQEGAQQVRRNLLPGGLNRVLLLTDGLANYGETRLEVITEEVRRLASEGVSTTALGLGDDYDEDLLEAIARSGEGNYLYVESPDQLADFFQSELRGLLATVARKVRLGWEPLNGVRVVAVLNDLDRTSRGRLKLPNLVGGLPVLVGLRLDTPPLTSPTDLIRFRLAWSPPQGRKRQSQIVTLRLPAVEPAAWDQLAPNAEVRERVTLLLIGQAKKEASRRLEQGDREGARRVLLEVEQWLANFPRSPETEKENLILTEFQALLAEGEWAKFHKRAKIQSYTRSQGGTVA